jgi:hypothetical protein
MSVYRQTEVWLAERVRSAAVVDTSGVAIPQAAGKYPKPAERDVLAAILEYLPYAKAVAWFARMNAGQWDVDGRRIRFGFVGCSDIIGQMRDGRFLAIEVKRLGGNPTEAQVEFLSRVQRANGVAFVARSVADVEHYFAVMAKGK